MREEKPHTAIDQTDRVRVESSRHKTSSRSQATEQEQQKQKNVKKPEFQKVMRSVAYLGPSGTFSHEAAVNFAKTRDASLVPQVTIRDVFDAVLRGSVTHGVVPIENSTNGSVTITFDLFRDLKHGNLKVCGQEFVQVKHALLGRCRLEEVERIYSHPQVYFEFERWKV